MEALVIGKPNVGKSLFTINFAAYLGAKQIPGPLSQSQGSLRKRSILSIDEARRRLVSPKSYRTLVPCRMEINLGQGREKKTLWLIDTTGIQEGVHHQAEIRAAMATTLAWLSKVDLVIHLVDATTLGSKRPAAIGAVDDEIYHYARGHGPYLLLANKTDKPGAQDNLPYLREHFAGISVIAVSALTGRGFREIKTLTLQYLNA